MNKILSGKQFHKCVLSAFMLFGSLLCISCGGYSHDTEDYSLNHIEEEKNNGPEIVYAGSYDSEDPEAVVVSFDKEAHTVRLYNREVKRYYTLSIDGATKFYDKYMSSIVEDMIYPGDVVDVTFIKSKKVLNSVQKATSVWTREDVKDFEINELTGNIRLSDGDYRFRDDIMIFADGKKAEIIDINDVDSLSLQGNGHEVYSIVVNDGHGYLRLKGQEYFIGGWLEIGKDIIKPVSEDMLLTVPIGTYEVQLTNGGIEGKRTVTIEKGKETELDISDMFVPEEKQTGDIIFVTSPEDAVVYLDGTEVDKSKPYEIEYGIHQLIVKADGYDTVTQYVKVGQEHATLEVTLDKKKEKTEKEDPKPTDAPLVTTYVTPGVVGPDTSAYKVSIESPEGAEVYLDGSYIGNVPVDFSKVPGSHVITLRKEGYETRSYTITLDEKLENEAYSFSMTEKSAEEP